MKTLTLFQAYIRANFEMESAVHNRRTHYGISVNDDFWARRWQKRDRLARKLEYEIERRLGGKDEGPICYLCGCPPGWISGCRECGEEDGGE